MVIKDADTSDLQSLTPDTGGNHSAYVLGETESPYGYYIYIPGGYDQNNNDYPLLIFLHGDNERGNSAEDAEKLEYVAYYGPPRLINAGNWNPSYPMIVASPQTHDEQWNSDKLDEFIEYMLDSYRVDKKRIYMTGYSSGGDGISMYLSTKDTESPVAAAVIIGGEGNMAIADKIKVPVWLFHGETDDLAPFEKAVEMANGMVNSLEVKFTVYPGEWHEVWEQTYDSSGIGTVSNNYDPFDISIYDW
ncbi:MAG: dienelactone hydrolase family protein, partial [Dehalococcoidales bacterium]